MLILHPTSQDNLCIWNLVHGDDLEDAEDEDVDDHVHVVDVEEADDPCYMCLIEVYYDHLAPR